MSCSSDSGIVDTAGSETTNTFTLRIMSEKDQNLSRSASVSIISSTDWLQRVSSEKKILDSLLFTDNQGLVDIPVDLLDSGNFNLSIQHHEEGKFVSSYAYPDTSTEDTILIKELRTLSGTIDLKGESECLLALQGTDFIISVDPGDTSFLFQEIPAGSYLINAISVIPDKDTRAIVPVDTVSVTDRDIENKEIAPDFNGLLIDDFNDGDEFCKLYETNALKKWYIVHEGDISLTFPSEREPDPKYAKVESALTENQAYEGKSLHMEYNINTDDFYLITGVEIGCSGIGMEAFRSISFMGKGNGKISLRLHGEEEDDKPEATCSISMNSSWTRHTITPDMFSVYDPEDVSAGWDDVKNRLTWLAFDISGEGTELWLDDIRLDSVTIPDMITPVN